MLGNTTEAMSSKKLLHKDKSHATFSGSKDMLKPEVRSKLKIKNGKLNQEEKVVPASAQKSFRSNNKRKIKKTKSRNTGFTFTVEDEDATPNMSKTQEVVQPFNAVKS